MNLSSISIIRASDSDATLPQSTRTPSTNVKINELPFLPIHPRFPTLLLPLAGVKRLYLNNVTFPSFRNFVQMLDVFRDLRDLRCAGVQWRTLGIPPPCLTNIAGRERRSHGFLPNLCTFQVIHVQVSFRGLLGTRDWQPRS